MRPSLRLKEILEAKGRTPKGKDAVWSALKELAVEIDAIAEFLDQEWEKNQKTVVLNETIMRDVFADNPEKEEKCYCSVFQGGKCTKCGRQMTTNLEQKRIHLHSQILDLYANFFDENFAQSDDDEKRREAWIESNAPQLEDIKI